MNKYSRGILVILVVGVSFVVGLWLGNYSRDYNIWSTQQTSGIDSTDQKKVTAEISVVREISYARCHHIVREGFENPRQLLGMGLDEVRAKFSFKNGYLVWFEGDNSLVIHQRVEDWCPEDGKKFHLGLFKDHVAVFKGPGGTNDEVVRVTGIKIEGLPEEVVKELENGKMEYEGEENVNFVLESLDEYE